MSSILAAKKVARLLISKKIYSLICYFLLVINLYFVSFNYFTFETDTKVAPYTPIRQRMPKLSLCFDLKGIFSQIDSGFAETTVGPALKRSVDQLFLRVPQVEDALVNCGIRNFDLDSIDHISNGADCASKLNITRSLLNRKICYSFSPSNATDYSFYSITHTNFNKRFLYQMAIKSPLDSGTAIYPLINFDSAPTDDIIFNQQLFPSLTENEQFQLSYDLYEIIRLPWPYETKCGSSSRLTCQFRCWDHVYRRMNLLSPFNLLAENTNLSHLMLLDYFNKQQNEEVDLSMSQNLDSCTDQCQYESCFQNAVKTYISMPFNSTDKLSFEVQTARFPVMKIQFEPKFAFNDYLVQILSLAGIWIEFAFLHVLIRKSEANSLHVTVMRYNNLSKKLKTLTSFVSIKYNLTSQHKNTIFNPKSYELKILKLVAHVSSKVLILFFLCWEMYFVAANYFSYETQIKFSFDMNPKVTLPSLSVCIKLVDLFDVKFRRGPNTNESDYDNYFMSRARTLNYTLDQLFDVTMTNEVLVKCRLRDWQDPMKRLTLESHSSCLQKFNLTKFYINEHICYNFVPREEIQYEKSQAEVRFLPTNPGILYSLILNPKLIRYFLMRFTVHFSSGPPYTSLQYGQSSQVHVSVMKRMQVLSYQRREVKRLEAPYDTNCSPLVGQETCRIQCYRQMVNDLQRVAYSSVEDERLQVPILNFDDLKNQSIYDYWRQLELKCEKECRKPKCLNKVTQTYISHALKRGEFIVEFAVELSAYPSMKSVYFARTTLYAFYYQTFCCLSFWLGVSFIGVDKFIPTKVPESKSKALKIISRIKRRIASILKNLRHFLVKNHLGIYQSKKKKIRQQIPLWKSIVYLACSVGCVLQIADTVASYIQYPTVIETSRSLDFSNNYSLSVCIDPYDSMDRSQATFTAKEMFELTPEPDDVIVNCAYWGLARNMICNMSDVTDRILFTVNSPSTCRRMFRIRKYILQGSVCYQFSSVKRYDWNRDQLRNVLMEHKFFLIVVNTSLLTPTYSLILSSGDSVPFMSSVWGVKESKKDLNIWYLLSYVRYDQNVLPPPYSDEGFSHMLYTICIDRCISRRMYNSSSTAFTEPSSIRLLGQGLQEQLKAKRTRISCEKKCTRFNDLSANWNEFSFTMSHIESSSESLRMTNKKNKLTAFYTVRTRQPVLKISFKPKISFYQLLINVGSIFGIWFGISVNQFSFYEDKEAICSKKHLQQLEDQVNSMQIQTGHLARTSPSNVFSSR